MLRQPAEDEEGASGFIHEVDRDIENLINPMTGTDTSKSKSQVSLSDRTYEFAITKPPNGSSCQVPAPRHLGKQAPARTSLSYFI